MSEHNRDRVRLMVRDMVRGRSYRLSFDMVAHVTELPTLPLGALVALGLEGH